MGRAPRVSIRPSALGGKGALLFCALELAFLATNYSNLFFLLLAFSGVLGALGAWWSARNLRGVVVRSVDVPGAAAGAARAVDVRVDAPGRPRLDVACELRIGGRRVEVAYAALCAGATALTGTLPPQGRGVAAIERAHLVSRAPFGLFVARLRFPLEGEVVTWPKPADLEHDRRSVSAAGDDGGKPAAGRGATLAGLRPFRAGDAIGDVHWKATARRGVAVVKERERDAAPAVEVVLDRRCAAHELEAALAHAAALVLAARHGAPLRLLSQDADLLVDADHGGADGALRWLAQATCLPSDAASPPRRRGAQLLPTRSGRPR